MNPPCGSDSTERRSRAFEIDPHFGPPGLGFGFAEEPETKDLVARKAPGNQGLPRWKPGNQDDGSPRSRSLLSVMHSEKFQGICQ